MHFFKRTMIALLLLALLLTTDAIAGGKDYSINDYSGSFWSAHALNDLGQVAGTAYGFSKDDYHDGAVFDGTDWHKLAGPNDVKIQLSPDISTSMIFAFYAKDINNAGQVVGRGDGGAGVIVTPAAIPTKKGEAVFWYLDEDNDGKNDLITKILIDGYNEPGKGIATHITDNGAVYGVLYDVPGTTELASQTRLYRWTPEDGAQIIDAPFPYGAGIVDVNEAGEIIGICNKYERRRASNDYVSFYWSEKTGVVWVPVDLGGETVAIDMNEAGEAIGRITTGTGRGYAFRWKPASGDFTILPEIQGTASAYAINDNGIVNGLVGGGVAAVIWDAQNNIHYLGNGTFKSCTVYDYNNNGYAFGSCSNGPGAFLVAWIPDATTGTHVFKELDPNVWFKSYLNESNQFVADIRDPKKSDYDRAHNEVIITLK